MNSFIKIFGKTKIYDKTVFRDIPTAPLEDVVLDEFGFAVLQESNENILIDEQE